MAETNTALQSCYPPIKKKSTVRERRAGWKKPQIPVLEKRSKTCPKSNQETQVRSFAEEDPPGEGNGNLPQDSCLGNLTDTGAWRAAVHRGVAKEPDVSEPLNNWVLLSRNREPSGRWPVGTPQGR